MRYFFELNMRTHAEQVSIPILKTTIHAIIHRPSLHGFMHTCMSVWLLGIIDRLLQWSVMSLVSTCQLPTAKVLEFIYIDRKLEGIRVVCGFYSLRTVLYTGVHVIFIRYFARLKLLATTNCSSNQDLCRNIIITPRYLNSKSKEKKTLTRNPCSSSSTKTVMCGSPHWPTMHVSLSDCLSAYLPSWQSTF